MKLIVDYYNKIFKFCMENISFTLTIFNISMLFLLLIVKDPFGFRTTSYENASPFYSGKLSSINSITLEKTKVPNSKFEIKKEGEDWKLSLKGKLYPVDPDKMDSLLKSIGNSRKYTVVSSSKEKLDEYGFNEDEIKLDFLENQKSLGIFSIGSVGSDGNTSHIKWNDSDDIYLIEENLRATANRAEPQSFLDKKVSPRGLTSEELIGITLNKAGNSYEIKKTTTWNLESPKKGEIASEDMNTTLSKLASITSDDIVTDETVLNGIDPFPYELKVDFKSKEGIPKSFKLTSAGFDKKLNSYYIRKNDEPTVYKLSEYSIKSVLEFKPETLVKK